MPNLPQSSRPSVDGRLEPLEGDFEDKMRQIKEARKKITLTFAKLTMQEKPLESKSAEEMTDVRLTNCNPKLRLAIPNCRTI